MNIKDAPYDWHDVELARAGKRELVVTRLSDVEESPEVLQLLAVAEKTAKRLFNGHLTIYRFTTNWRVAFGTPSLADSNDPFFERAFVGGTLEEALHAAIVASPRRQRQSAYCDDILAGSK